MRPLKRATRWRLAAGAATVLAASVGISALMRPKAIDAETARVARADLLVTVDAEGRTRVRDRFVVVAPVAGRLQRIAFTEGSAVGAGDVVARLAPAPLDRRVAAEAAAQLAAARSAHAETEARVAQGRARLADAERNAERYAVLLEAGAVAPRDRERVEMERHLLAGELAATQSRARAAAADVDRARAALISAGDGSSPGAMTEVRAPASGRVLRVPEPSERVVAAGSPLLEIGDAHALEVVADARSGDAVRVRPGAPVLVDGWGGEWTIHGRVRSVEPSGFTKVSALGVEEQRVNVVIDLDDCPDALGDGYRVEARIVVAERRATLAAPASALFRSASGWSVFVVHGGAARLRDVKVGERAGATVELLGGVAEGDALIVFPSDAVKDGARVRAR